MSRCVLEVSGRDPVSIDIAEGEIVLDGVLKAGWEIPYSCRTGACETCRAPVTSGAVSPPASADGTALLCRARACGDIVVRLARLERASREATRRFKARVYRVSRVDHDVAILDLRFPAGTKVRFKAGQYLQVHLQGQTAARSFSMANSPAAADSAQLHVRVLPGSVFGEQVLPALEKGSELEIELPFGDFYLREGIDPVLLVAGGTGFAPVQAILDAHLAKQPERQFTLYWGARTTAGLYALDKIQKWERLCPNFGFVGVVSREEVAAPLRRGRVHEAVLQDHTDLSGHQVFVCGSPALVISAREAFTSRGMESGNFYSDGFAVACEIGSG